MSLFSTRAQKEVLIQIKDVYIDWGLARCVTSICGKGHDKQLYALLILIQDSLPGQQVHSVVMHLNTLMLVYFERI